MNELPKKLGNTDVQSRLAVGWDQLSFTLDKLKALNEGIELSVNRCSNIHGFSLLCLVSGNWLIIDLISENNVIVLRLVEFRCFHSRNYQQQLYLELKME